MPGGRPTTYKKEWKSENEIVDFLLTNKELIEPVIGGKVKEIHKEVAIPFGIPRKGAKDIARVDILIKDNEDRFHIIEVKHPKDELLENSKGIAQLLFYEAMLHEKEGITVASMNLITSSFDVVSKNIVPRNNLKVNIVKANRDSLEVIIGFQYKVGRPKEYRDTFPQEAMNYVKECAEKSKDPSGVYLPTVEGFAIRLGFSKETIYAWERENEEFSDALDFLRNNQCIDLINNGLANKYNPTIAKLILSANHGMAEKTENKTELVLEGVSISVQK